MAQTVYDPTTAEFGPSPDHNATNRDGTPVLSYYLLEIFPVGSSKAAYSISLGKPSPGANGLIRVTFVPLLPTPLAAGTSYQARVSAVGPGGSSASQASNVFAASAPCAPSLSTRSLSAPAAASSGSLKVSAGTTCEWNATANVSWLTITSSRSVTGPGAVTFTVAANSAQSSRSGTLTIAGSTFTVTQAGSCAFTVTPTSVSVNAAGGKRSFSIATGAGCAWTATGMPSWITVAAATGRTGSGSLSYTIGANAAPPRSATLTIAGRTIVIKQSAPVIAPPGNFHIVNGRRGGTDR